MVSLNAHTVTLSTRRVSQVHDKLITTNKRIEKMQVTVTDNQMKTIAYGYSPEHYAGVVEFYSDLVQAGEIYTYTVKM